MREYTLNMLSHADQVKGQGVLSAYEEELALVTGRLDRLEGDGDDYRIRVRVNARTVGDVTHIHTVNPEFFLQLPLIKARASRWARCIFCPRRWTRAYIFRTFSARCFIPTSFNL